MKHGRRNYVFLGLSITSTWGNGHATTYRGLLKELTKRGHSVTFLERDVPWYSANREFDTLPFCNVGLYSSIAELKQRFGDAVREADAVVVGSYVPDGAAVGRWVTTAATNVAAFYDIDTPVTLAHLRENSCDYLSRELVRKYSLYLSFTGGPILRHIEEELGSPGARALYCSVDPAHYYPEPQQKSWNLAYLGTFAADRQASLDRLLLNVAASHQENRFAVAGPQYPAEMRWPENVDRIEHLPASGHREFYNRQQFTLNITRRDMIRAGYSPSVRLFEAAACGIPIVSDEWPGMNEFFEPGREILPVWTAEDVAAVLELPADRRHAMAERARDRTLRYHTAAVRAAEFEYFIDESLERQSRSNKKDRVALSSVKTLIEKY